MINLISALASGLLLSASALAAPASNDFVKTLQGADGIIVGTVERVDAGDQTHVVSTFTQLRDIQVLSGKYPLPRFTAQTCGGEGFGKTVNCLIPSPSFDVGERVALVIRNTGDASNNIEIAFRITDTGRLIPLPSAHSDADSFHTLNELTQVIADNVHTEWQIHSATVPATHTVERYPHIDQLNTKSGFLQEFLYEPSDDLFVYKLQKYYRWKGLSEKNLNEVLGQFQSGQLTRSESLESLNRMIAINPTMSRQK